jgi:hypothetical protein
MSMSGTGRFPSAFFDAVIGYAIAIGLAPPDDGIASQRDDSVSGATAA